MKDLMIGLETMGYQSTAAIVQIGACYFDIETLEMGETFLINIDLKDSIQQGLTVNAETILFWMDQPEPTWRHNPLSLRDACCRFRDFAGKAKAVWAHASFDFPILGNAFEVLDIKLPYHYRDTRDLRTIVDLANRIVGKEKSLEEIEGQETEGKHDALCDCIRQAAYCHRAYSRLNGL